MRRDLGDFQTPPALVSAIVAGLGPIGERWPRVLEPTCGRGHFITGLLEHRLPPRWIRGIELQAEHVESARAATVSAAPGQVEIIQANLFELDLRRDLAWAERGPLLVIGNPPWVTNAELGAVGSRNLPRKTNLKGELGLAAKTGASNFDIAEAIWLKLIDELADEEPTIALLCKTSVARSVLKFVDRGLARARVADASIRRIDASGWFGASVDASLFRLEVGRGRSRDRVAVFGALDAAEPETEWGVEEGRIIADLNAYHGVAFADGRCPLEWRQGLKHDAAPVMELTHGSRGVLRNKLGGTVEIEAERIYPLVKATDLARGVSPDVRRSVIVTQHRIGEDTRRLEHEAPQLWNYLTVHEESFVRRKSSIYRGQPPFALFGIGPYSFAPYKVAVSGLHKEPRFRVIGPVAGRPVMLDDTCYFLPCATPALSALMAALLNDPISLTLIRALTFHDAKRPITKSILRRVDLMAILERADPAALRTRIAAAVADVGCGDAPPCWCECCVDEPLGVRGNSSALQTLRNLLGSRDQCIAAERPNSKRAGSPVSLT